MPVPLPGSTEVDRRARASQGRNRRAGRISRPLRYGYPYHGSIGDRRSRRLPCSVDERALTERLITYDTSQPDGIRACAGFIKGWLEAREIDVHDIVFGGLPVLTAGVGPARRARR